jgi:anti-sigma-K factor RskA
MTMDEEKQGLAAEFALGTLDADERAQADALMLLDPEFAAEVRYWERRLGELNVLVAPVEPSAPVWERIRAAVAQAAPAEAMRLPEVEQAPIAPREQTAEIFDLTRRMRRWRQLSLVTSALAACLVGIVVVGDVRPDLLPAALRPKASTAQYVAVFQKDEQSPSFVMSVDIEKRTVSVRQVAAERYPDKTYQLWIATQPGVAPASLGLIQKEEMIVRANLSGYEPNIINNATFGISLEPLGGSPTGQPTTPAIHAKLLQVTPAAKP